MNNLTLTDKQLDALQRLLDAEYLDDYGDLAESLQTVRLKINDLDNQGDYDND